jgi:hypothetical protein
VMKNKVKLHYQKIKISGSTETQSLWRKKARLIRMAESLQRPDESAVSFQSSELWSLNSLGLNIFLFPQS